MGFSVMSLIEIVYYITLRPYCASRRMQLQKKRRLRNNAKQPNLKTISLRVGDDRPPFVKPFTVQYQHVRRRLCDIDLNAGLP